MKSFAVIKRAKAVFRQESVKCKQASTQLQSMQCNQWICVQMLKSVLKFSLPVCTWPDSWTPPEEGPLYHWYQCLKFWIFQREIKYVWQLQSKCKLQLCETLILRTEKPAATPWLFVSLSKCCSYSSVEYFTVNRDAFWKQHKFQAFVGIMSYSLPSAAFQNDCSICSFNNFLWCAQTGMEKDFLFLLPLLHFSNSVHFWT